MLVQTLAPDAPSIAHAARHDSDGFLAGELERREALRYPPFSTLIRIVCSARGAGRARTAPPRRGPRAPRRAGRSGPAPLFRLRGRERAQVVVKAADRRAAIADVDAAVRAVAPPSARTRRAAFSVDVDPQ